MIRSQMSPRRQSIRRNSERGAGWCRKETVEVAERETLLDATTSEMCHVVDNRSIVNLPLNQRNSWSLV